MIANQIMIKNIIINGLKKTFLEKRIEEIIILINKYNGEYFVDVNPIVDGHEYEGLKSELIKLEKNFMKLKKMILEVKK